MIDVHLLILFIWSASVGFVLRMAWTSHQKNVEEIDGPTPPKLRLLQGEKTTAVVSAGKWRSGDVGSAGATGGGALRNRPCRS